MREAARRALPILNRRDSNLLREAAGEVARVGEPALLRHLRDAEIHQSIVTEQHLSSFEPHSNELVHERRSLTRERVVQRPQRDAMPGPQAFARITSARAGCRAG